MSLLFNTHCTVSHVSQENIKFGEGSPDRAFLHLTTLANADHTLLSSLHLAKPHKPPNTGSDIPRLSTIQEGSRPCFRKFAE